MRAAILLSFAVIRRIIFWLEFDDIAHVLRHHLNPRNLALCLAVRYGLRRPS
jgi:hypothetical protein